MPDRFTQSYIEEERKRCRDLAAALAHEKDFLIHCIEYSIQPNEIEARRRRFEEMKPAESDDLDFLS